VQTEPAQPDSRIRQTPRRLAARFEQQANHGAAVRDLDPDRAGLLRDPQQMRHEAFGTMTLIDLGAGSGDTPEQDGILLLDGPPQQAERRLKGFNLPR
jgi:hypothetical protein